MNESGDQFGLQGHNPLNSNPLRAHLLEQFEKPKVKPDFSVLESNIKLPPLVKLKPDINPLLKKGKQTTELNSISNALKNNITEQRELLLQEFQMFAPPQDFQFYFPQSKFPPAPPGESDRISYERQPVVEVQNTFRDKLSAEQIADIREKGQFAVKSSRENVKIPYVWKMNETLFKGIKNVQRDWNQRFCAIVGVFQDTWRMLTQDSLKQLANIGKFPWRIITLLFGKKQMRVSHSVNFEHQIAKDFWNEVMTKHYIISKQWNSDLWTYLDSQFKASVYEEVPFNRNAQSYKNLKQLKAEQLKAYDARKKDSSQKINQLNTISNKFEAHWDKVSKKIFTDISNSVQQKLSQQKSMSNQNETAQLIRKAAEQTQILDKFREEQFTYYLDFFQKQSTYNKIPMNVIDAILTLLTLMHVAKKKQAKWEKNFYNQKDRIQKEIKTENPIRSLNWNWFQRNSDSFWKPIEQRLNNEFYNQFLDPQLRQKLNAKQVQVFNLWVDYIRTYKTRLQRKEEQIQNLYEPKKTFQLSQMLIPPYDTVRHDPGPDQNSPAYYTMPKERLVAVTTASCAWKFKLYCTKLKVWGVNAFITLIYFCWKSTFGLRCLCGVDDFVYDQSVEYSTGRVIDDKRKTVLGHFLQVLKGISESRENFEALPDTGIFGKNCSRICNILECYVFRLFIVGVLVILTFYPIAIIFGSIISFFMLVTIWAWMPIAITFNYLFNILIYNLDSFDDKDCLYNLFPFFVLIFRWIFSIAMFIFYVTSFFIFMPLASFFILLYACICRCVRSMTDCGVLCFLSCCGRVPSTNSMFAEKISGPGMASQFYMSINEEDVYYLIQAELQQLHIHQLQKLTKKKLYAPIEKFKNTMRFIVEPLIMYEKSTYGTSADSYLFGNISDHPIDQSIVKVQQQLNKKLTNFIRRYPKYPQNVRFTEQELNQYFQNTQSIVKAYVDKHKLHKWIFAVQDVPEYDFAQLTRSIWIKIFRCGESIFEPIESIDERIRFEDEYSNSYGRSYKALRSDVGSVVNAIKGEADLKSKKVVVISPLNTLLFNKKHQIVKVQQILDMKRSNSDTYVFFNKSNPLFIFCPHLSIKELIKHDQNIYTKLRGENRQKMENW